MNWFCKDELDFKFQHDIRACRIQIPPTYPRTQLKKSDVREGGALGKTQAPHKIDKTLDNNL